MPWESSLTTPSFSDSLNLLTWNMFNFCECHCNQWREGKHLWRETAQLIKVLQLYPKTLPSPGEKMRPLKGKWEEERGKWGHNKTNLYPPEASLCSRPSCFCPAVPALCSPTHERAQPALKPSLPPAPACKWRMTEVTQKGDWSGPGDLGLWHLWCLSMAAKVQPLQWWAESD